MQRSKKILELFSSARFSKDIQEKMDEWLVSSYKTDEKDKALSDLWDTIPTDYDESTEKSLNETFKRIEKYEKMTSGTKINISPWLRNIAIIAIIMLSTALVIVIENSKQNTLTEYISYSTCFVPNGETRKFLLPDSSEVNLNSGSILVYPEKFTGKKREVYLIGEARFSVTKDKQAPFIVKTSEFAVNVVGTVFNVSSYSNENISSVTVKQGVVNVSLSGENASNGYQITPNEQLLIDKKNGYTEERDFDANKALAWEKGGIMFDGETIHEIAKMIERKYGISVYITNNKYDNARITAKFIHGETIEEFLSVFSQIIPGMKYEIINRNVYIE